MVHPRSRTAQTGVGVRSAHSAVRHTTKPRSLPEGGGQERSMP
jgi:hypothetical protein